MLYAITKVVATVCQRGQRHLHDTITIDITVAGFRISSFKTSSVQATKIDKKSQTSE